MKLIVIVLCVICLFLVILLIYVVKKFKESVSMCTSLECMISSYFRQHEYAISKIELDCKTRLYKDRSSHKKYSSQEVVGLVQKAVSTLRVSVKGSELNKFAEKKEL